MPLRRNVLLPALALATAVSVSATARGDMMTTCASEISRYCSAVTQGRGRISACLASYMGGLSAACRAEVQAVGQSRLTPAWVRPVFNPAFRAPLPAACTSDAARFCPGMSPGEGRVFACLYAFSDRVSRTCGDAAQAAMKQAN
jgi:cysteine rich repeat protein